MADKEGRKTGGRKSGTPNRRTQEAIELSEKLNVDPLEILLLIAKGDWEALGYENPQTSKLSKSGDEVWCDRIELDHRLAAAKESCKYIYPARKAVELKDQNGDKITPVFTINMGTNDKGD